MIISCNECDSSFAVDDNLIKEGGSKVRCSKCNSIFVAYPQPLESNGDDDLGLDDLDASMAALEDDDESLGLTDDLSDELELDLDDFDDALTDEDGMEAAGLSADADDELELGLDDMSEDEMGDDELPDLGDFEDLAGLDDTEDGLEDFDLDLEDDTESDGLDFELEGDQELDLEDLDEAEATADSDDLDLDLDLDLGDDIPADDLSDDFELDLEEEPDGEAVAEAGADIEDADELDLSDLELEVADTSASDDEADAAADDLDLDLDFEEETAGDGEAAEAGIEIEEADELDLSSLELEMEDASVSDGPTDADSDDVNLGLDLEEETVGGGETAEAGGEMKDADELDLSDLEEIIDSEESPAPVDAVEDLELDFGLDGEPDSPTGDAGAAADGDSELDFSDLEQMLETDDAPAADGSDDELDLQFDLDEQPASGGGDAPAAADISDSAGEDDFLDIEKMLEAGDDATSDLQSADEDLSLTMEAALDDPAQGADDDLDLDFDIESELQENEDIFDSSPSGEDALEANLLDADDAEFLDDSGTANDSQPDGALTDEFSTDEFSATEGDFGATDVLPMDEEGATAVAQTATAKPAKTRSKKPILVIVLLLILAVGVIVIPKSLGIKIPYISDIKIPYLSDLDLNIPYLSDWLNPEEQDVAGNLRITPLGKSISGSFVDTAKSGRLFVIRGKIKNEYDHPRSFVKVTGKLYQGKNKLVRKSTVYIGNVIPESELADMGIAAINKRMKNKFGDKRSNLKIKTGKVVPFMIVFDKLPNNLDEYTVEVASSSI
jgi:predicted Zn finger-like uncharacterized protein